MTYKLKVGFNTKRDQRAELGERYVEFFTSGDFRAILEDMLRGLGVFLILFLCFVGAMNIISGNWFPTFAELGISVETLFDQLIGNRFEETERP